MFTLLILLLGNTLIPAEKAASDRSFVSDKLTYENLSSTLWASKPNQKIEASTIDPELAILLDYYGLITDQDLSEIQRRLKAENSEHLGLDVLAFIYSSKSVGDYERLLDAIINKVATRREQWLAFRVFAEELNRCQIKLPADVLKQINDSINLIEAVENPAEDLFLRNATQLFFGSYLFYCYAESELAFSYLITAMYKFSEYKFSFFNADYVHLLNAFNAIMLEDFYYLSALATSKISINHLSKHALEDNATYNRLKSISLAYSALSYDAQLNADSTTHYAKKTIDTINHIRFPHDLHSYLAQSYTLLNKYAKGNQTAKAEDYFTLSKELFAEVEITNNRLLSAKHTFIEQLIAQNQLEKASNTLTETSNIPFPLNTSIDALVKAQTLYLQVSLAAERKNLKQLQKRLISYYELQELIDGQLAQKNLNQCLTQTIKYYAKTALILADHSDAVSIDAAYQFNEEVIKRFFYLRTREVYGENMLYVANFISPIFRLQSELSMHLSEVSDEQKIKRALFYADLNRAQLLNEQLLMHNNLTRVDENLRASFYQTDIESEILRQKFQHSLDFSIVKSYFSLRDKRIQIINTVEDQIGEWNNLWLPSDNYVELIRKKLDPNQSILLYALDYDEGRVFVLNKDGIHTQTINYNRALSDVSQDLTRALIRDQKERANELIDYLSKILIEPIEPYLKTQITYIADASIDRVPFSLLNRRNGEALINSFELTKTPSARYFATKKLNRQKANKHFVGISPVVFNGEHYDESMEAIALSRESDISLPFTKIELELIEQIISDALPWWNPFASYEKSLLMYENANKRNILSQEVLEAEILHFASHSITDVSSPAKSRVLLYSNGDENKDLQIREIYYVNMHNELLVLNGCLTGTGKVLGGEGIIGLTHAFLTAGVNNIIATYWPVNDRASSLVMKYFYQDLFRNWNVPVDKRNYAQSLRNAILVLRQNHPKYDDPIYWGSFYLLTASHHESN